MAAGADGLIIESHPNPPESISDADQAISLETLTEIVDSIIWKKITEYKKFIFSIVINFIKYKKYTYSGGTKILGIRALS